MILELLHILNNPGLYAVTYKNGEIIVAPLDTLKGAKVVGARRA